MTNWERPFISTNVINDNEQTVEIFITERYKGATTIEHLIEHLQQMVEKDNEIKNHSVTSVKIKG